MPNTLLKDIINGKNANIRNNKIDRSYPVPSNISTIHSAKMKIKIEPIKFPPPNIRTNFLLLISELSFAKTLTHQFLNYLPFYLHMDKQLVLSVISIDLYSVLSFALR